MRWVGWLACLVAVVAVTGCQTLRDMGLESRGARMARSLHAQNQDLAAKNAELETRLIALGSQHDKMKQEYEATMAATAGPAASDQPSAASLEEQWSRMARELQGVATPIVTPDGDRGFRVAGDILFRSGQADVRKDAKAKLGRIASATGHMGDDVTIFVDGHTDSDPLRRTKAKYGDNYGLGAARANSVARELVALGVPRTRVITRSFGKDRPIAENKTARGKGLNRRVEIIFAFTDRPGVRRAAAER